MPNIKFLSSNTGIVAKIDSKTIFRLYKTVVLTNFPVPGFSLFFIKINRKTVFTALAMESAKAIPAPLKGIAREIAKMIFAPNPIIPAIVGDFVLLWA